MLSVPGHDVSSKDRTLDVITKENVSFKDLYLSSKVLSGLLKARFERPSPIQLKAIPYGRCGLDLIVQAKSGTGKTCVFTVIALEAIAVDTQCLQVIILAPTREIAVQIEEVITAVGQDVKGLKVSSFIGGRPVNDDKTRARGCHIAVGSPGRIFQLIELDVLKCQSVRLFVLDEADKLLEANFQSQINSIYSMLPANKQMIAASATYPEELAQFVTLYMREPTFVRLNPCDMALLGIKQYYHLSESVSNKAYSIFENKIKVVIDLLSIYPFQQALIFSNYHAHAKDLSEACNSSGLPATYISGNMEQERRLDAMKVLKDFRCKVLISTDLTARGIDASNVDLVVNLDVPYDWETYMHRTGRSGRFGTRGAVISIVTTGKEVEALAKIAETCSVSILPILLNRGRVEFGKDALRPSNKEGNGEIVQSKATSINIMPTPSASTKTNIKIEGKCHKENIDAKNKENKLPLIPSLPALMSFNNTYVDSNHYSFSYKDLMENFLHFKETDNFAEMKQCDYSPPVIDFFGDTKSSFVHPRETKFQDLEHAREKTVPARKENGNIEFKSSEPANKPLQDSKDSTGGESREIPSLLTEKTKPKHKKERKQKLKSNHLSGKTSHNLLLPHFSSYKSLSQNLLYNSSPHLEEYTSYCNIAWRYYHLQCQLYWQHIHMLYRYKK